MKNLLNGIRCWPLDKKITLAFPVAIFIVALVSGSLFEIQPEKNKVALLAGGLYLLLTVLAQPLLQKKRLKPKHEWFLYEFWPVLAMLLGYLTMRVLRLELAVEHFFIAQQDGLMIQIDKWLFSKPVPLYLQYWISPKLTVVMESAYLHFYYLLPIGSLLYLYWNDRKDDFLRLRKGLIYTLSGGFVFYFCLPVEGPLTFMAEQFDVPLRARQQIVYDAVNSFRFDYDCFPSLHTAIPWLTVFLTWTYHGKFVRVAILFMTLAITFSTMYLRYHYGADVIAGFIWAVMIAWVCLTGQGKTDCSIKLSD